MALARGGAEAGIVGGEGGGGDARAGAGEGTGANPACFTSNVAILSRRFWIEASVWTAPGLPQCLMNTQRNSGDLYTTLCSGWSALRIGPEYRECY